MPPRIPPIARLSPQSGTPIVLHNPSAPSSTSIPGQTAFTLPLREASTLAQRRRHHDPYAAAQARARKAANLSRQSVLEVERTKARGNPVRGVTRTSLIEAFKTGAPLFEQPPDAQVVGLAKDDVRAPSIASTSNGPTTQFRNYFLNDPILASSTSSSQFLRTPLPTLDPRRDAQATQRHRTDHDTATEAITRITAMENASSKDRTRVNVQRCIELFGRHNTDGFLREKLQSRAHLPRRNLAQEKGVAATQRLDSEVEGSEINAMDAEATESPAAATIEETQILAAEGITPSSDHTSSILTPRERAGPDTGSPEVQIGILTARINTLADALDFRGRHDKVNKRNLRLLVHKRQKLLKYLRRNDRGGERWQRCVGMLGLGEAAWKGEISL